MLSAALLLLVASPGDPGLVEGLSWRPIKGSGDPSKFVKAARQELEFPPKPAFGGKVIVTPVGSNSMVAVVRGKLAFGPLELSKVVAIGTSNFKSSNGTTTKKKSSVTLHTSTAPIGSDWGDQYLIFLVEWRGAPHVALRYKKRTGYSTGISKRNDDVFLVETNKLGEKTEHKLHFDKSSGTYSKR